MLLLLLLLLDDSMRNFQERIVNPINFIFYLKISVIRNEWQVAYHLRAEDDVERILEVLVELAVLAVLALLAVLLSLL